MVPGLNLSEWRLSTPDDPNVQVAVYNIVLGSLVLEPASLELCSIGFGSLLLRRWGKRAEMQDEAKAA